MMLVYVDVRIIDRVKLMQVDDVNYLTYPLLYYKRWVIE